MNAVKENGNASALRAPGELRRDLPAPTPGPWRVRRLDTHHRIEADALSHFSGSNMAVCELHQWSNGCGPDVVQQAVNARLIAAAPCLLEALKELLRDEAVLDDGDPRLEASRAQARAALTKAGV